MTRAPVDRAIDFLLARQEARNKAVQSGKMKVPQLRVIEGGVKPIAPEMLRRIMKDDEQ